MRAADLALAIDAFSEDFRARAREQGISLGATRIGLHKGDAVIGNFGGARFFDYTGIGDTMNTAARLEAANRHFATRICASEAIVRDCPNHLFRPIGSVLLKGKSTALPCFELVAPAAAARAEAGAYRDGFDLIATDPAAARAAFEALRHDHPGDGLVAFQLERLRAGATGTLIRLEEK